MDVNTPPLPSLSTVNGKTLIACFDGGSLSSDAGLLALREVERRLDVVGRLAACIDDPRARGVGFIFGLPTTAVLSRHMTTLEASTAARAEPGRQDY